MKNITVAIVMASLAAGLALDAAAQQTQPTTPRETAPARESWQKPEGAVDSKHLIGARIKNAEGKDIGEIDGLMVNTSDGKITHAIVGRGGFAGLGETKVVVPWSEVKLRRDRDNIVVSMDASVLERAPRYERKQASAERTPAASPATTPRTEEKKKSDEKK